MYGLVWWFLGPLTLMPLFMGMGLGGNWNGGAMVQAAPTLLGRVGRGFTLLPELVSPVDMEPFPDASNVRHKRAELHTEPPRLIGSSFVASDER